jgi:hypothetical protein
MSRSGAGAPAPAPAGAPVVWPTSGVIRVHYVPEALPRLGDEPGTNRFDDPRPRTINRFLVRYAATTLCGCLLELLASFRDNAQAREREAAIDVDDPDLVDAPVFEAWQHLSDYLAGRKVASVHAESLDAVSINDPVLQHELDIEPAVRAILDSEAARSALLDADARRVHLDNAAIRLSSPTGRDITQACALALFDRLPAPDVIHYRSRHDDGEDCWAIYNHAKVEFNDAEDLSPDVDSHVLALRSVASLWQLTLPPEWTAAPN